MGGVRVLVGVQLGPVVEVHRLHGAGAVRVSVHGGRDAHAVHGVVGQVFVLHTGQGPWGKTQGSTEEEEEVKTHAGEKCVSTLQFIYIYIYLY